MQAITDQYLSQNNTLMHMIMAVCWIKDKIMHWLGLG
jgi:hypothetical protein